MELLNYLLIAIALSMDAFSVSISLQINKLLSKSEKIIIIIAIGIFHFIMPFFGDYLGQLVKFDLGNISRYILAAIFIILSIEIITDKNQFHKKINIFTLLFISLTVSLDSMTVGVGLSLTKEYTILASIIFSISSMFFTTMGLIFGDFLNKYTKEKANLIGVIILIILAVKYIFNI